MNCDDARWVTVFATLCEACSVTTCDTMQRLGFLRRIGFAVFRVHFVLTVEISGRVLDARVNLGIDVATGNACGECSF